MKKTLSSMRRVLYTFAVFSGIVEQSQSATLEVVASQPQITVPSGTSAAQVSLLLRNPGLESAAPVIWQTALVLVPDPGSSGSMEIASFSAPIDYVFAGLSPFGPMPSFGSALPGASASFSDAALSSPAGGHVAAAASVGLLDLTVSIAPGTSGAYRLVLKPFNEDPLDSSSWGDATAPFPTPFVNGGVDLTSEQRTLTTIVVQPVPEPASLAVAYICVFSGVLAHAHAKYRGGH
jgi:hypothetical protein